MLVEHHENCRCARCLPAVLGGWVDHLGSTTSAGAWQVFGTLTYKTPQYPWARGFPITGCGKPSPAFGHRTFDSLIRHLEREISTRLDYVVADQFGSVSGRFHQHCVLAGVGLESYSRKEIWSWLKAHAGWSRILPFEKGAAYYISRYIGRDIDRCDWFVRIGDEQIPPPPLAVGKETVARSASVSKALLHMGFHNRHR